MHPSHYIRLYESDRQLRVAEAAFSASSTLGNLHRLMLVRKRSGIYEDAEKLQTDYFNYVDLIEDRARAFGFRNLRPHLFKAGWELMMSIGPRSVSLFIRKRDAEGDLLGIEYYFVQEGFFNRPTLRHEVHAHDYGAQQVPDSTIKTRLDFTTYRDGDTPFASFSDIFAAMEKSFKKHWGR